jgi:hypothetical protein
MTPAITATTANRRRDGRGFVGLRRKSSYEKYLIKSTL